MVASIYCRKCGTKLPPESQFCPTCGTSQGSDDHSLTSVPTDPGTGRLPPGRILHQRYRLLQTVGQGGMGAVYLAQDTQLGDRLLAIKEMSISRLTPQQLPQAVEQFKQEAHLLAGLQHPNLPVIYEYFGEGDRWYLVMSFIQGGTLQAHLDAAPGHKLPVEEVVRIGIELCTVLEYLHTHQPQIIFRDLKPLNIMITPKGQIYLIDFGIARHFKQDQTKDTVYYYSVGYAPPEQYGQSQTGPRSDLYSLGATLYQMLSGHNPASKPFHFPSLQVHNPTIPAPLAKLIAQTLDLDEQQRPASAAVVKEELQKMLKAEQGAGARVEEPEKEAKEKKSRNEQQDKIKSDTGFWQRSWNWLNQLFGKWRIPAWIGFIVLSAFLGIWGAQTIHSDITNYNSYDPIENFFWFADVCIGVALVGLAFLLAKGRAIIDMLGGIAFIVLGDILLLYSSHLFFASSLAYNAGCSLCSAPSDTFSTMQPIASIGTLFLFFLGTRFFVRSANPNPGYAVGTLTIITAIIVIIASQPFLQINYVNLPNFVTVIAIVQILLGVAIIIMSIRRSQRNKQGEKVTASTA